MGTSTIADRIESDLLKEDPAFLDIVQLFVEGLPKRLDHMEQAIASRDFGTLRILAHQLKGSGGGHGFACLSCAAAELETAANQTDAVTCSRLLGTLRATVARIFVPLS